MSWFKDSFGIQITDSACPNTYRSGGIRVSVITERLIRVEWQSEAVFCDKPTQSVLHRDLGAVHYSVARKNGMICVNTALARLIVDENTGAFKQAKVKGGFTVTDIHEGNLLGTVRTLDNVKGATKLEEGILSKNGAALLDDSASLTLEEDGRVLPRKKRGSDVYYFLYGHDYITAVKDFYRLTGSTPLIPRFALSNWWSRYKAYTQEEYLALMHKEIHPLWAHGYLLRLDTIYRKPGSRLDNSNLEAVLEITLNSVGTVTDVRVVKSSGISDYDSAAIDVAWHSSPQIAPPHVMISKNGKSYVHWTFWRDGRQCGVFGVKVFKLDGTSRDALNFSLKAVNQQERKLGLTPSVMNIPGTKNQPNPQPDPSESQNAQESLPQRINPLED